MIISDYHIKLLGEADSFIQIPQNSASIVTVEKLDSGGSNEDTGHEKEKKENENNYELKILSDIFEGDLAISAENASSAKNAGPWFGAAVIQKISMFRVFIFLFIRFC